MDNISKLKSFGKKTISKNDLSKLFSAYTDEELFSIISNFEKESILIPVKSSKTNGNIKYPIYLKYKIKTEPETYDEELNEIKKLHPVLQNAEYLMGHPEEYRKNKNKIDKLNTFLFKTKCIGEKVSRKERSFQIFGEEKFLDDKTFCNFLSKLGLDKSTLAFYDTPEYCFNDYIPERKDKMILLICENKDIWFNIRRRMFEDGANEFFNVKIDGVVYGCGNKVSEVNALTSYSEFMKCQNIEYLYWGDIDRAGFNIYLTLKRNNPDMKINLFSEAYEVMLELSQYCNIPNSDDKREIIKDYTEIYSCIKANYKNICLKYIEENKRLPQEIVSYTYLKENSR